MSSNNKELEELKEHLDDIEVAEEENIIVLTDADGNEVEFEFLDLIEYNGEEYAVLLPTEDEEGTVVILKSEKDDDGYDGYYSVEDDAVVEAVFEIFKENFKDIFNFQ